MVKNIIIYIYIYFRKLNYNLQDNIYYYTNVYSLLEFKLIENQKYNYLFLMQVYKSLQNLKNKNS